MGEPASLLQSAAYATWMERVGITAHAALHITSAHNRGYYARAAADIGAGELLLAVPLTACYDLAPTSEAALALAAAGAPPLALSALQLLWHLSRDSGAHAAVLRSIHPEGTILSWTERERALLQGTSLERSVDTMPLLKRFHEIVLPALRGGGASGSAATAAGAYYPAEATQEAAFLHAAKLVMSRCFHGKGSANAAETALRAASPLHEQGTTMASDAAAAGTEDGGAVGASKADAAPPPSASAGPFLVPVCDFFNYSPTAAATTLCRVGDAFHYYTISPVAAGEEIFASYGKLSDAQLLHTYGFVMEDGKPLPGEPVAALAGVASVNPHDTVMVALSDVRKAALNVLEAEGVLTKARNRVVMEAVRMLHNSPLLTDAGFVIQFPPPGTQALDACLASPAAALRLLPRELLTAIQVLLMDAEELRAYKSVADECAPAPLLLPLPTPADLRAASALVAGAPAPKLARTAADAARVNADAEQLSRVSSDEDGEADDEDDDGEASLEADTMLAFRVWPAIAKALTASLNRYPTSAAQDASWYARILHAESPASAASSTASSSSAITSASTSVGNGAALVTVGVKRTREGMTSSATSSVVPSSGVGGGVAAAAHPVWSLSADEAVELGVADYVYRCCRLLAYREKAMLTALQSVAACTVRDVLSIIAKQEDEEEGGEEEEESGDDEDEDEDEDEGEDEQ